MWHERWLAMYCYNTPRPNGKKALCSSIDWTCSSLSAPCHWGSYIWKGLHLISKQRALPIPWPEITDVGKSYFYISAGQDARLCLHHCKHANKTLCPCVAVINLLQHSVHPDSHPHLYTWLAQYKTPTVWIYTDYSQIMSLVTRYWYTLRMPHFSFSPIGWTDRQTTQSSLYS